MRISAHRVLLICLMTFALVVMAPFAAAAQESFRATHYAILSPDEETQPVADFGSGIAILDVRPSSSTINYRVTVTGIGNITGTHFHRGPAGADGPVVAPIPLMNTALTVSGTLTSVSSTFIDSLLFGQAYLNVHSTAWPDGQIRGQIIEIPNAGATEISAVQEPHAVANDSGSGSLVMWVEPSTRRAIYALFWESLTGPATAAHFHLGETGVAGPPIHTITIPQPEAGSAYGLWLMTPEQFAALLDYGVYVNIHTALHTEGEIRGQVSPVDVFTASISASNEVPSLAGQSQAAGTGIAFVERLGELGGYIVGQTLVEQTTGPITAAHVHDGPIGQNGAPIFSLIEDIFSMEWFLEDFVSVEELQLMRDSGTYVNFHTARFTDGEARGQLIPAANNLSSAVSAIPVLPGAVTGADMDVAFDRSTDAIRVTISGLVPGPADRLRLLTLTGENAGEVSLDAPETQISVGGLPAGGYFLSLVTSGRAMMVRKVIVAR